MNRDRLTREQYDLIRAALDARARERFARDPNRCKGCGGDLDTRTIGCKGCWDRWRRRKRRLDPVLAELERERERRSRARCRQRRREAA